MSQQLKSTIAITDEAATHLKELIAEHKEGVWRLRIWVSGGGCSGLQYGMALDENSEEGDVELSHNGVDVLVDPLSIKYLNGATVEYMSEVLGGGFKINNPNSTKSCGCGSSFAVEGEDNKEANCGGCGLKDAK